MGRTGKLRASMGKEEREIQSSSPPFTSFLHIYIDIIVFLLTGTGTRTGTGKQKV
jgi:hypothetical protein